MQAPWYSDRLKFYYYTMSFQIPDIDKIDRGRDRNDVGVDIRELPIAHELIGGLGEDEVVCVIIAG